MKKHRPTVDHPTWNWEGQRIDLRELKDAEAARLLKAGCKLIEKVPAKKDA